MPSDLFRGWTPFCSKKTRKLKSVPIALCGARGYIPPQASGTAASCRRSENPMRAEVERLVEEIKQSVGLLRRHL
jgi:hypothetical protein